jgi:hypothetical protein
MTWVPRHGDRLVGSHGWRERRGFETLGRWAQQSSFPPAKLALDRHSQHHAWRAMQWQERLPLLAGADRESLVVAPDPGTEASFEEMSRLEGDAARLAGAYRFALPRLATAYRAHLAEANPLSEGPTIRLLRIFLADVQADWLEGEVVLEAFLAGSSGAVSSGIRSWELSCVPHSIPQATRSTLCCTIMNVSTVQATLIV